MRAQSESPLPQSVRVAAAIPFSWCAAHRTPDYGKSTCSRISPQQWMDLHLSEFSVLVPGFEIMCSGMPVSRCRATPTPPAAPRFVLAQAQVLRQFHGVTRTRCKCCRGLVLAQWRARELRWSQVRLEPCSTCRFSVSSLPRYNGKTIPSGKSAAAPAETTASM